jgi:flagellar export protein FliJ
MSLDVRLAPLANYAEQLEDQAARALSASSQQLSGKEAELAQLRAYLAEYRRSLETRVSDAARWQNAQAFLARLGEAVAVKESELKQATERHRLQSENWRAARERSAVLDRVIERSADEERRVRGAREQHEQDEQAAQAARLDVAFFPSRG